MIPVRAKKNLGQHFLKEEMIADRIAATLDNFPSLPVLEVGPGTGMLTKYLLKREKNLTVVEIDHESVDYLQENYPALQGRILQQDFLRMNFSAYYNGEFCVIGNYPYNISSQIFKVIDTGSRFPVVRA